MKRENHETLELRILLDEKTDMIAKLIREKRDLQKKLLAAEEEIEQMKIVIQGVYR